MNDKTNPTALINCPARRQTIAGITMALGSLSLISVTAWAGAAEALSHSAESIHQEIQLKAARKRVYEVLTDAMQFDHVVQLSEAAKTRMSPGAPPTQISREVGGAFSMFGGLIVGRHVELAPNVRIVQAWRPAYWDPGVYSIVKFELADSGTETKLVLDHKGFPNGDGKSLLEGWTKNYWEPMAKYLA